MESITNRIDFVTQIPSDYRNVILKAPPSVKIEITATCNFRCGFCVKSQRSESGQMDRKFFSRIIREMRDAGVNEIGLFFIGESFTCQWLPDAIEEAKEVGFPYTFLTTNGSVATQDRLKAVFDAGLDSLKFSLNYADEDQFKSVARVTPRLYYRAIENIKEARRLRDKFGYKCKLYASSIAFDGEQGEAMQDLVNEIIPFVDQHYWLPLFNMGGASRASGMKPIPGNPGRLGNMREPLPCWSVFREAHITHDGLLAACCFGSGITGKELIMGDLNTTPFMDAWNSQEFQDLRKAHLDMDVSHTACSGCIASN